MIQINNQQLKDHAIDIMRRIGLSEAVIKEYKLNDVVPQFAHGRSVKGRVWNDVALAQYRAPYKPYAVVTDNVHCMKMVNFLYLSPYPEDLEYMLRPRFVDNMYLVYAYCYNLDFPDLSESGSILIVIENGCIRRIG